MVGVDTDDGPIDADAVVAATGPWVNRLAAPLGETLPITPIRVQMVHLRRPPSLESLTTNVIDYTTGGYYRVMTASRRWWAAKLRRYGRGGERTPSD